MAFNEHNDSITHLRDDIDQYLTFFLGHEEYGLDILQVQEIKGWGEVTKIPNTPHYMLGIINLRGAIVPIIDLRIRFGLDLVEYTPTTVVIVAKVTSPDKNRIIGIVVDAVAEVYDLTEENLKPPPDFGCNIDMDYVTGLASIDEKIIIMLDVNKLIFEEFFAVIDNKIQQTENSSKTQDKETI